MLEDKLNSVSHRRLNPLTGEWIIVSPHRLQRPWQGQVEAKEATPAVEYDPSCYLCPGNLRAGGQRNPPYTSTFVFENDYAPLHPGAPEFDVNEERRGLIMAESESGICRVLCFAPQHNLTLSRMAVPQIRIVVDRWCEQFAELAGKENVGYVQIFENRGALTGTSNPHPHCQIWAVQTIPNEPRKETFHFRQFLTQREECLLCSYVELEQRLNRRIVCANERYVALVPHWAYWPFETMILPRRHAPDVAKLTSAERDAFASILKRLTTRYDHLFDCAFPYSMGFHQRPTDGANHEEWHFHIHFYPPLLRSATIRKFMGGFELLCTPERDFTPEMAAERLRAASEEPTDAQS